MKSPCLLPLLLVLALCGCTTRYVDVRGEKFEMLSHSEERELINKARLSLRTISTRLSPQDMKSIQTTEPETRYIYSGDRYGRVIIKWQFKRYEVGVEYEGQLMSRHMASSVFSRKKYPEDVGFLKRQSDERKQPRKQGKRR